jgi:ribonucleoside-diphosphate reductase alpha chain
MLADVIRKEVAGQGIESFSQSFMTIQRLGLVPDQGIALVQANARKLDNAIDDDFNRNFEYFGLQHVYDKLLLRSPEGKVLEPVQKLRTSTQELMHEGDVDHGFG